MTKYWYIVVLAVGLVACKSTQAPLVDDAYYWPDKTESVPSAQTTQTTQTTQPVKTTPTMEIVNQQDTTITIRIKR